MGQDKGGNLGGGKPKRKRHDKVCPHTNDCIHYVCISLVAHCLL